MQDFPETQFKYVYIPLEPGAPEGLFFKCLENVPSAVPSTGGNARTVQRFHPNPWYNFP